MSLHKNSFDFLRLVFALLVIITHSVILSGHGEEDFLMRWTHGQINCSYLGVRGFFIISGFLVFKSLQRSRGVADYLQKRLLRIFPGLLFMLLVVVIIAGPFLSGYSAGEYFNAPDTWHYITSVLRVPGLPKTSSLPGVFTHNPTGSAVNGSLWTIWFELIFYIILLALFPWRQRPSVLKVLLPVAWLSLYGVFLFAHDFIDRHVFPFTGMSAEVAVDLGLYFLGGAALTLIPWQSIRYRNWLLIVAIILVTGGLAGNIFHYTRYISLPLLILAAGHCYIPAVSQIRQWGEPSYGIYIYAYPVQQTLVQLSVSSPLAITILTMLLATALGLISWHLIEKPALKLKSHLKTPPAFS